MYFHPILNYNMMVYSAVRNTRISYISMILNVCLKLKVFLPCNKCTFKVQVKVYIYTLYILYTIIQNLVLNYPFFYKSDY